MWAGSVLVKLTFIHSSSPTFSHKGHTEGCGCGWVWGSGGMAGGGGLYIPADTGWLQGILWSWLQFIAGLTVNSTNLPIFQYLMKTTIQPLYADNMLLFLLDIKMTIKGEKYTQNTPKLWPVFRSTCCFRGMKDLSLTYWPILGTKTTGFATASWIFASQTHCNQILFSVCRTTTSTLFNWDSEQQASPCISDIVQ